MFRLSFSQVERLATTVDVVAVASSDSASSRHSNADGVRNNKKKRKEKGYQIA